MMKGAFQGRGQVLSIVERGWRGARECSLTLSKQNVAVTHLVKGYLPNAIRQMIAPAPRMRIIGIPRLLFRPTVWMVLLCNAVMRHFAWALIDHERTLRQVSRWSPLVRLRPVAIHETDQGYELRLGDRQLEVTAIARCIFYASGPCL